jgi:hypothetical protein
MITLRLGFFVICFGVGAIYGQGQDSGEKTENIVLKLVSIRRAQRSLGLFRFFDKLELLHYQKKIQAELGVFPRFETESLVSRLAAYLTLFFASLPLFWFQLLFLLLLLVLASIVVGMNWVLFRPSILSVFLVTTVFLVSAWVFEDKPEGVIFSPDSIVVSGPGDDYPVLFKIRQGSIVRVLKQNSDYFKILRNTEKGWIKSTFFQLV